MEERGREVVKDSSQNVTCKMRQMVLIINFPRKTRFGGRIMSSVLDITEFEVSLV